MCFVNPCKSSNAWMSFRGGYPRRFSSQYLAKFCVIAKCRQNHVNIISYATQYEILNNFYQNTKAQVDAGFEDPNYHQTIGSWQLATSAADAPVHLFCQYLLQLTGYSRCWHHYLHFKRQKTRAHTPCTYLSLEYIY